jgi:2-polyprenyl-3-methyl-5-hydroxy-6-metoxy-1,4-benzoquinol methylase
MYDKKNENYFAMPRYEILNMAPDFSDRVLEIGCGSGSTLHLIKQMNRCRQTVGIELFEDAANKAKKQVDDVFNLNIENSNILKEIGRFDLILLLDVLEHLVDPWSLLESLVKNNLSKSGVVIVSLPNARNYALLLPLIMGRLDYKESGILDKTHLRFFTLNGMIKMFNNAGLKVITCNKTNLSTNSKSGILNRLTLGIFSNYLAVQYIFKLKN